MCYLLKVNSEYILGVYQIGNEMLILNGLITFILLFIFSKKNPYAVTH